MKLPAVKNALDIPEKPAEESQPDLKVARVNPFKLVVDSVKNEFSSQEQARAEIVDGATPGSSTPTGPLQNAPSGPPPMTFAMPPKRKRKDKGGKK